MAITAEERKVMLAEVRAMMKERAKFPKDYVSPVRDAWYGDGPMSHTSPYMANEECVAAQGQPSPGSQACMVYWFKESNGILPRPLPCSIKSWPPEFRDSYRRAVTVREQYDVMAAFTMSVIKAQKTRRVKKIAGALP